MKRVAHSISTKLATLLVTVSMVILTISAKTLTSHLTSSLPSRIGHLDQASSTKAAQESLAKTWSLAKSNIEGSQLSATKTYINNSNKLNKRSKQYRISGRALVEAPEGTFSMKCKALNLTKND